MKIAVNIGLWGYQKVIPISGYAQLLGSMPVNLQNLIIYILNETSIKMTSHAHFFL